VPDPSDGTLLGPSELIMLKHTAAISLTALLWCRQSSSMPCLCPRDGTLAVPHPSDGTLAVPHLSDRTPSDAVRMNHAQNVTSQVDRTLRGTNMMQYTRQATTAYRGNGILSAAPLNLHILKHCLANSPALGLGKRDAAYAHRLFFACLRTLNEQPNVSSTVIIAPALSCSPRKLGAENSVISW